MGLKWKGNFRLNFESKPDNFGFDLLRFSDWHRKLAPCSKKSDVKQNSVATLSVCSVFPIFCFFASLYLSFHWLFMMQTLVKIIRCDYYGFSFWTVS